MAARPPILTQVYDSPCGKLILGSCRDGLCLCDWVDGKRSARVRAKLLALYGDRFTPGHSEVLDAAAEQLDEYFAGERRNFDVLTLSGGTEFRGDVWWELIRIPYGQTISYAGLAARIGRPSAVRAVAGACAANPLAIFIPCHRVIAADGSLGGYSGGLAAKQHLLDIETKPLLRLLSMLN